MKSVQAAARKALNNTTPEQAVHDKHHWMIVTVPERPAAGEELIIYFNRNTSETLRWVGVAVGWNCRARGLPKQHGISAW